MGKKRKLQEIAASAEDGAPPAKKQKKSSDSDSDDAKDPGDEGSMSLADLAKVIRTATTSDLQKAILQIVKEDPSLIAEMKGYLETSVADMDQGIKDMLEIKDTDGAANGDSNGF